MFEIPANIVGSGEQGAAAGGQATSVGIGNVGLELQVLDWDRVTKNEIIGRVTLGLGQLVASAGKTHWQAIMENPRKQIAEWHRLAD